MKQAFIVVALLVAIASPAAAQGTTFGARVGVNFANLSFDPDEEAIDTSTRTAIVAGAFVVIPINPRFAFQPEVLYSEQGAKGTDELGTEGTFKFNYVNIPLLANIGLSDGPNRVSLLVGPQIGFRTSAKLKVEDEELDFEEEIDLDEDTESTDFGLVAGIAANIRNFVIDARYTHGFSNINADDDDDQKIKHRVFTISVGISFR